MAVTQSSSSRQCSSLANQCMFLRVFVCSEGYTEALETARRKNIWRAGASRHMYSENPESFTRLASVRFEQHWFSAGHRGHLSSLGWSCTTNTGNHEVSTGAFSITYFEARSVRLYSDPKQSSVMVNLIVTGAFQPASRLLFGRHRNASVCFSFTALRPI